MHHPEIVLTELVHRSRAFRFLLTMIAYTSCVLPAHAAVLFSVSSDAPDPARIAVGEIVHVQLSVSGITAGDQFVALSAQLEIDPAEFDVTQLIAGPIVPDPLDDPLDFVEFVGPGFADATFLTLGDTANYRITSDGIFFSVELKAKAAGLAAAQILFVDALQADPTDPQNLLTPPLGIGPALNLQVVPEQSSVALISLGLLALIVLRLWMSSSSWRRQMS